VASDKASLKIETISIIGLGYVGLALAKEYSEAATIAVPRLSLGFGVSVNKIFNLQNYKI
jgi:UDP-N-acetyl-D-mannosaminuronate dehydrogenase